MSYRWKNSQRFQKRVGTKVTSGVGPSGGEWESKSAFYEPVIADLEIEIDVEGIAKQLGFRALHSKRHRAAALHGLIKVKMVKERTSNAG